jgi:hypothetical protein
VVVTLGEFAYVLNADSVPVLVPPSQAVKPPALPPSVTGPAGAGGTVGKTGGLECTI